MVKVFHEWKARRKVEVPVLNPGGAFKDYRELHKVQPLSTDLEIMDACSLDYLLSKFVQGQARRQVFWRGGGGAIQRQDGPNVRHESEPLGESGGKSPGKF